jgi:hypothetical protein
MSSLDDDAFIVLHFSKSPHNGVTQEARLPNRVFRSRRELSARSRPLGTVSGMLPCLKTSDGDIVRFAGSRFAGDFKWGDRREFFV